MKRLTAATLALGGLVAVSNAASLNLHYSLAPSGSLWDYTMTLSVDESVTGWSSGMGWTWITFGDVAGPGTSPLADFVLTSAPPPVWDSLSFSSGGHNGPTWLINAGNVTYWVPTAATDTLTWTGTSSFHATPGSLFFSELLVTGGATRDDFKEMLEVVPEPASAIALLGLLPIAMRRRRARK
jgi:hypothetical protein